MSRSMKVEQILGTYNELLREMSTLVVASEKRGVEREPWMSVEQAAAYIGIEPGTIRTWIDKGALQVGRFGNVMRVRASAIDALLTENQPAAAPKANADAIVRNLRGSRRGRRAS